MIYVLAVYGVPWQAAWSYWLWAGLAALDGVLTGVLIWLVWSRSRQAAAKRAEEAQQFKDAADALRKQFERVQGDPDDAVGKQAAVATSLETLSASVQDVTESVSAVGTSIDTFRQSVSGLKARVAGAVCETVTPVVTKGVADIRQLIGEAGAEAGRRHEAQVRSNAELANKSHQEIRQALVQVKELLGHERGDPAVAARVLQAVDLLRFFAGHPTDMDVTVQPLIEFLKGRGWERAGEEAAGSEPYDTPLSFDTGGNGDGNGGAPAAAPRVSGWVGRHDKVPALRLQTPLPLQTLRREAAEVQRHGGVPAPLVVGQAVLGPSELASVLLGVALLLDQQVVAQSMARIVTDAGPDDVTGSAGAVGDADGAGPAAAAEAAFNAARRWREWLSRTMPKQWPAGGADVPVIQAIGPWVDERTQPDPYASGLRCGPLGPALPGVVLTYPVRLTMLAWWQNPATRPALLAGGAPAGELAWWGTAIHSFVQTWLNSHLLGEVAGHERRKRLILAWAQMLLDLRASVLRHHLLSGLLGPDAFQPWVPMLEAVNTDLARIDLVVADDGWLDRLDGPALARRTLPWPVPPVANLTTADAAATGPAAAAPPHPTRRWLRPPLLPVATATQVPAVDLELCEVACPQDIRSPWQLPIVALLWAGSPPVSPADHASLLQVMASLQEIDANRPKAGEKPGKALRDVVIDKYWIPLYAIADARLGLSQRPPARAAARAWLEALSQTLAYAHLRVLSNEVDPDMFTDARADSPVQSRPPLTEHGTGKVVSRGLRPAPTAEAGTGGGGGGGGGGATAPTADAGAEAAPEAAAGPPEPLVATVESPQAPDRSSAATAPVTAQPNKVDPARGVRSRRSGGGSASRGSGSASPAPTDPAGSPPNQDSAGPAGAATGTAAAPASPLTWEDLVNPIEVWLDRKGVGMNHRDKIAELRRLAAGIPPQPAADPDAATAAAEAYVRGLFDFVPNVFGEDWRQKSEGLRLQRDLDAVSSAWGVWLDPATGRAAPRAASV